jgi:hypothetical protein
MPTVCQLGMSGADSCSGWLLWQTRHDSSDWMGKWHSVQCRAMPLAHWARWLRGAVSVWQRTQ